MKNATADKDRVRDESNAGLFFAQARCFSNNEDVFLHHFYCHMRVQ